MPGQVKVALPASCTSQQNAATANADTQLVRVTHPFHPLFPRQLPCVGKRYNRHGERLLLQTEDATVWSVPPQWTDLVSLDPEVVMSNGRSLLRVVDLMELATLVKRLSSKLGPR
ncbi:MULTISPECIES: DUF5372 family protein [unclassified Rhizobium]|uniref:DUF5372 family protein n=2 Tax=unclassified Rhizobium TaxID=2613769 RepID=UPI001ADCAA6A|nr:hypothetical protein [Rhizobium sp. L58/93]QXZ87367.1 hypothetical protein J5287_22775 [Rhizobium sp. K1/93]QXZ92601.1 hypothetical protein J5280_26415 [Rhizobium sp. K15/93]QYA04177.1 hypothetical protein J5278_25930 [Rhizobium sp. B21/90]